MTLFCLGFYWSHLWNFVCTAEFLYSLTKWISSVCKAGGWNFYSGDSGDKESIHNLRRVSWTRHEQSMRDRASEKVSRKSQLPCKPDELPKLDPWAPVMMEGGNQLHSAIL